MQKFNLAKEKLYGKLALAHAEAREDRDQPLPTIRPGQPEWEAWQTYFHSHMGFEPYAMTRVLAELGSGEMTVPTQTPEEFDASYVQPKILEFHHS